MSKGPAAGGSPDCWRGLEDANAHHQWRERGPHAAVARRANAPLTLVPSYPDLPMEQVYPRVPQTDIPGCMRARRARGRVVYFPFDIDRTFWEVLSGTTASC